MTKKTYAWAKRTALVAYKKALKAAERGHWQEANSLTNVSFDCAFCQATGFGISQRPNCRPLGGTTRCPVTRLCGNAADKVAWRVLFYSHPEPWGIRRLRSTIAQLERLDVVE